LGNAIAVFEAASVIADAFGKIAIGRQLEEGYRLGEIGSDAFTQREAVTIVVLAPWIPVELRKFVILNGFGWIGDAALPGVIAITNVGL
jgi:hypothetical protein